ncbi:MAG TPA: (5-formylfuran-3-yl)methyl phosphate synthase [Gemmatimonadales bacterium]
MQLLVSVRSAAEVAPALAGGADIIDAKEPARGPLGAVAADVMAEVLARVPEDRRFSAALGDLSTEEDVLRAFGSVRLAPRRAAVYLKAGFGGVSSATVLSRLLDCAIEAAARHPGYPRLVAVAYADRAGFLPPADLAQRAAYAGAAGVLLDTYHKDGRGLFGSMTPDAVAAWVAGVRRLGLLAAVAGEIGLADMETVQALGVDIVGVRGAACEGGRGGTVSAQRVTELRLRMTPNAFGLSSIGGKAEGLS